MFTGLVMRMGVRRRPLETGSAARVELYSPQSFARLVALAAAAEKP